MSRRVLSVCACALAAASAAGAAPHAGGGRNGAIVFARTDRSVTQAAQVEHVMTIGADGAAKRALAPGPGRQILPAWSPDGSRIAYVDEGPAPGVVVRRGDGSRATLVASLASQPAWSPDGLRLAVVIDSQIAVGPASGGPIRVLAPGYMPVWAPDGSAIAALGQSGGLRVIDPASGVAREVVTAHPVYALAEWAADGGIVFASDGAEGPIVASVRADGSGERRLAGGRWARWSPDGELLAVAGAGGGVQILRRSGAVVATVPNSSMSFNVSWSPDGRRLAFVSGDSGLNQVATVGSDGAGARTVTKEPRGAEIQQVEWSPDGRRIAYVRRVAWVDRELYAVSGGRTRRLTNNTLDDLDPAWSPDGATLAFDSGVGSGIFGAYHRIARRIAFLDVQTGRTWRLAAAAVAEPAWSPEGARVAAVSDRDDSDSSLSVFALSGRQLAYLGEGREPSWSPDGKLIAFSANGVIGVVRPNGAGRRRLLERKLPGASADVHMSSPSWSPDGTQIAFDAVWFEELDHSGTVVDHPGTYVARRDGTRVRRIAPRVGTPSWSPDGRFVLTGGVRVNVATGASVRVDREGWAAAWQPVCDRRGTEAADRIAGSPRPELVCGFGGRDTLVGGGGRDRLLSGAGDDFVDARDGGFDVVGCGPGRDSVSADRVDLVGRDCELVRR